MERPQLKRILQGVNLDVLRQQIDRALAFAELRTVISRIVAEQEIKASDTLRQVKKIDVDQNARAIGANAVLDVLDDLGDLIEAADKAYNEAAELTDEPA